jgi:hypothetical protein
VKRYLDHLCSEKPSPPPEVARCSVNRNKRALYGSRPAFLDYLPPFDVAGGVFDACRLLNPPDEPAATGKDGSNGAQQQANVTNKRDKVKSMMSKMLTMAAQQSRDSDVDEDGGENENAGPGGITDKVDEKNSPCPCSLCNGQLLGLQVSFFFFFSSTSIVHKAILTLDYGYEDG